MRQGARLAGAQQQRGGPDINEKMNAISNNGSSFSHLTQRPKEGFCTYATGALQVQSNLVYHLQAGRLSPA